MEDPLGGAGNKLQNIYKCKCCDGQGTQRRSPDCLKVYCPACNGTGEAPKVNENIKFDPNKFPYNSPQWPNNDLIC